MRDISWKLNTLRIANAQSIVNVSDISLDAIKNNTVPKGDIFEIAKVAGFLAVKNTSNVIPHCHPIPIEDCTIDFDIKGNDIIVNLEVKTIYKTGIEVEAMYGASVVAITIYDLLKPIDKKIVIRSTKLISKSGGKSSFKNTPKPGFKSAVIVMSDTIAAGKKEDKAGLAIKAKLETQNIENIDYVIIPDEPEDLKLLINKYAAQKYDLVIAAGGTGVSPRDITPETLIPMFEREVRGIAEAARAYGQERTPYSMLSRSVAGLIGKTLIIALPGSTKGASESMDAIFPYLLHIYRMLAGERHDTSNS
ncbi:MAG: bifunctional molybdenum cofactor biosynthesis protein MoaC/MoaB [Chlorobi bacterium]|nr:bifunctional molybdenum cofactor biosynthesis protein MoaC/MoaB [Chlorobiota bacterium]